MCLRTLLSQLFQSTPLVVGSVVFHTENLAYWPDIRHLSPLSFVIRIDRFYQYHYGQRLLLWTYEDLVYQCECLDQSRRIWSEPQEIGELTRQRVVSVVSSIYTVAALTDNGRLFTWREESSKGPKLSVRTTTRPQVVLRRVRSISGEGASLLALLENGTVWEMGFSPDKPSRLEPLVQLSPIVTLSGSCHNFGAITMDGKAFARKLHLNWINRDLDPVVDFQVTQLELPHPGIKLTQVVVGRETLALTNEGYVYCYSTNGPNGVNPCTPLPLPIPEPIRRVYSRGSCGIAILEARSGRLYLQSRPHFPSVFKSVADLFSVFELYQQTPGITRITHNARVCAGLIREPLILNVLLIWPKFQLPFRNQHRRKCKKFYQKLSRSLKKRCGINDKDSTSAVTFKKSEEIYENSTPSTSYDCKVMFPK